MSKLKLNEEEIEKYASYARTNLTVIELTYCYAELKVKVETLLSEVDELVKQNERYRSCLQWYADKRQWDQMEGGEESPDMGCSIITSDYGKRARDALGNEGT
jgi:hypothetical protein